MSAEPRVSILERIRAERAAAELAVGVGNCVGCGEAVAERAVWFCRGCDSRMCCDCSTEENGYCGPCAVHQAGGEPDPDRGWDSRFDD